LAVEAAFGAWPGSEDTMIAAFSLDTRLASLSARLLTIVRQVETGASAALAFASDAASWMPTDCGVPAIGSSIRLAPPTAGSASR
jgi:hypothetical protein